MIQVISPQTRQTQIEVIHPVAIPIYGRTRQVPPNMPFTRPTTTVDADIVCPSFGYAIGTSSISSTSIIIDFNIKV